ncbi:hypothetical protein SLNWT_6538 [Streptomyces albus]|uniref:Uncharacterized protein n=1 Tax=Streptomyces albus (strain ATCC 21838 / DSM 41398 / FERM P-419 / JCM 4703 / NBRC 107858) TaxID=1081613 RepID=A0A0B5EYS1_STRA4|nr:hypothetical protein SLNWT_6538 [Streptomyces albus]
MLGRTGGPAPRHGVGTHHRSGVGVEEVGTFLTVSAHAVPLTRPSGARYPGVRPLS